MLFIIAGHCVTQNDFLNIAYGINLYVGAFLGSAASIGVNCFLFIGVYFMVDADFNARRIVKLYGNLIFYTIPLTMLMIVIGADITFKDIIRSFFPFVGKALWFASSYIALILISPWLKKVKNLSKESHLNLLVILFFLISVWVTIYSFDRLEDQWLDSFVWFIYSYIFISYVKKYNIAIRNMWALVGVICYFIISMIYAMTYKNPDGFLIVDKINFITHNMLCDIKCVPNSFIAFSIFMWFKNMKIGSIKWINLMSAGTFAVYIIHQTPSFIDFMWKKIFIASYWIKTPYSSIGIVAVSCLIFILFSLCDYPRLKYLESIYINSKVAKNIITYINNFYTDVFFEKKKYL